jgi:Sec-independent protein translocase protein TatA
VGIRCKGTDYYPRCYFGGKKIPELIRGIGKGIREFKDAKNEKKEIVEGDDKS